MLSDLNPLYDSTFVKFKGFGNKIFLMDEFQGGWKIF